MSKTKKSAVQMLTAAATGLFVNEKIQKTLFGTYSDGTPRSLPDCLEGEILSPRDRERMIYRKKKKNKKKKKPALKKKHAKVKIGKIDL